MHYLDDDSPRIAVHEFVTRLRISGLLCCVEVASYVRYLIRHREVGFPGKRVPSVGRDASQAGCDALDFRLSYEGISSGLQRNDFGRSIALCMNDFKT